MQFLLLSTSAAIGLMAALAAVPVIIHLINMMRHRRVKWAAMEFLLQSYKKQRNWIFLKQLLLLLLRMAALVAAVAMLARLDTADRLAAFFGGKTTHHYLLIDDSYSMSEESGGSTAFERAVNVAGTIARRAAEEPTRQRMTLIRFSRATLAEPEAAGAEAVDTRIDLSAEIIDAAFDELFEEKRRTFEATELSVGGEAALDMVRQLVSEAPDETAHVYLLSDFRANQWRNPSDVRKILQELEKKEAELHLVRCASEPQTNLAITRLTPADQTRAAGVPLYAVLKVKNFGPDAVEQLPVKIQPINFDPANETLANQGKTKGEEGELITELIEKIDPGETAERLVQVYFPYAGKHVLQATLPDDAVPADNRRYCAVDFPEGVPVLLVDDKSSNRSDAYYLASVFQPGERANTGVRPEIKTSAFLRDTTPEMLSRYHAVYLLNVPRLDESAVNNLRRYVTDGGGLAIFLGPDANISFYNGLYAEADGLFPVQLDRDDLLPPPAEPEIPDFRAAEHPVFLNLSGESNEYLRGVVIERYFRVPQDFAPSPQSSTEIIARLRNRLPLAVARNYGAGRVVAFLTTAAPVWNNWAQDDSYGLMVLNLQSYLAAPGRTDREVVAGGEIDVRLDVTEYRPELSFYVPGASQARRQRIVRNAVRPKPDAAVMQASIGVGDDGIHRNGETDRSGIYEAWSVTKKNDVRVDRFAVNVDPREGNLEMVESTGLAAALQPVTCELHLAEEYQYETDRRTSSNWTNALLALLIVILLSEQAMAYSASYHPARGGAA